MKLRIFSLPTILVLISLAACNAGHETVDAVAEAAASEQAPEDKALAATNVGNFATAMCYLLTDDTHTAGFRLVAAGQTPGGVFIVETRDPKQGSTTRTVTTLANGEPAPGGIVTFDASITTDNATNIGRHRWSFNLRSATFLGDGSGTLAGSMTLQRLDCGSLERSMDFTIKR